MRMLKAWLILKARPLVILNPTFTLVLSLKCLADLTSTPHSCLTVTLHLKMDDNSSSQWEKLAFSLSGEKSWDTSPSDLPEGWRILSRKRGDKTNKSGYKIDK